jgi:large repetitive protein
MPRPPALATGVVLAGASLLCLLTASSFAQAPVVNPPTISSEPAFEGMITFRVTGTFTSSADALGQPFTATVNVGGVISPATVSGTGNPFTYRFTGGRAAAVHGTFPVTVSVTDKDGNTGTRTTRLTVSSVVPVVARVSPTTVNDGIPTDFTLGFTHPGARPGTTYSWNLRWGDGALETGTTSVPGFFTRRHTYEARGSFDLQLFVVDKDGTGSSRTTTVRVVKARSTVTTPIVGPTSTSEGAVTSFTVTGTFTHPPGAARQPLTATVDWGDGSTSPAPVSAGATFGYSFSGNHTYAASGTYDVTVAVADKDGPTGTSASSPVTVDNAAPTVAAPTVSPTTTNEGAATTFTVTGIFTDPGGATDQPFTATVHWGDGSTSAADVSGVANPFAYRFNGSHAYAVNGTYAVKVVVTDKDGLIGISAPHGIRVGRTASLLTLTTWALLVLALGLIAFVTHDAIRG